jgi:hypothetical protein
MTYPHSKQRSVSYSLGSGRGVVRFVALLSVAACGVVEHPHDTQAIDTSGDFGPLPTAGGPPAVAGASVAGGSGGSSTSAGGVAGTPGSSGSSGSGGNVTGTSGAPASGVTINLGGVEVPKEKAIAFIHVGHSNMAGRAKTPQASQAYHFRETHPHAYMYHPGSMPALALEPETAGDADARSTSFGGPMAGPGTALVKEAAMLAPDHYFISLGFAVKSKYCSQFLPDGLYYPDLIAGPKAIKGRVTFGGIFIFLGITERHGTEGDVSGFPSCINSLVSAIRSDVGEPNLPILLNDYEVESTGEFVVGGAVYNAIYPQIQKVPTTVSNSALVSCAGLTMQDDHHFNLDDHRTWVQRALMTMKTKGWFPWAP